MRDESGDTGRERKVKVEQEEVESYMPRGVSKLSGAHCPHPAPPQGRLPRLALGT